MNDYMVVVSSRNVLKLAHIETHDLRLLGPPRLVQLHTDSTTTTTDATTTNADSKDGSKDNNKDKTFNGNPLTIVMARVNAQGRRVALMTRSGPFGTIDTRIWLYDADTDHIINFDFASIGQIPDALYWNTP